jgi:NAD(P) transhydrogenase subunit alpha
MHSLLLLATARIQTHTLAPLTAAEIFPLLFILILAGFVGYEVIGRVSPTLHTPLMAATNAISGISLVGSLVAAGGPYSGTSHILGMIAVCAASINVVGGFMITDRMLRMFKRKPAKGAKL